MACAYALGEVNHEAFLAWMEDCVPYTVARLHLPIYDYYFAAPTAAANDRLRFQIAHDICREIWDGAGPERAGVGRDLARAPGSQEVYLQYRLDHMRARALMTGPDAYTAPLQPFMTIGWQLLPDGIQPPRADALAQIIATHHPGWSPTQVLPGVPQGAAMSAQDNGVVNGTDIPVPPSDDDEEQSGPDSFLLDNSSTASQAPGTPPPARAVPQDAEQGGPRYLQVLAPRPCKELTIRTRTRPRPPTPRPRIRTRRRSRPRTAHRRPTVALPSTARRSTCPTTLRRST